jgi:hypothetical protein
MNLNELNDEELINVYPSLLNELKKRGIIRTNNLIGELGEYIAVSHYKNNPSLPDLTLAQENEMHIDAENNKKEGYSVKSTSTNITGVFSSIPLEDNGDKCFDYLVIVVFNKDYSLKEIYELTWKEFLHYRRNKPPENRWNIPITVDLKRNVKKIY